MARVRPVFHPAFSPLTLLLSLLACSNESYGVVRSTVTNDQCQSNPDDFWECNPAVQDLAKRTLLTLLDEGKATISTTDWSTGYHYNCGAPPKQPAEVADSATIHAAFQPLVPTLAGLKAPEQVNYWVTNSHVRRPLPLTDEQREHSEQLARRLGMDPEAFTTRAAENLLLQVAWDENRPSEGLPLGPGSIAPVDVEFEFLPTCDRLGDERLSLLSVKRRERVRDPQ